MKNENTIPEKKINILTLTDEKGNDVDFERLDRIGLNGKEYLVLMPVKEKHKDLLVFEEQSHCPPCIRRAYPFL